MSNLMQGQNLQNAYTAQPFSNAQNQAYNNQGNQSAYMRALVPDLLGQIGGQQVGFDRSNQNARPNAFNFAGNSNLQGLLAQMASGANNSSPMQNTPQVQPKQDEGTFMQQNGIVSGMNMTGTSPTGLMGNGGYGTFKYGMPTPQPGSQQYRDMSAYFANGGLDPNNYYGKGADYKDPNADPRAYMWTSGFAGGAPGEGEGPSSGAPGGGNSAGPAGTF
ncbi:hypothetical protein J2W32_000964 [Variovorax boronicumulans]|uniref:Uncharacterized protein n=1 Tax=Variovorax boronicumulans TaxID=436515 RepID=A0AAW8CUI4_9BURK|nr:hypothetical protein [Variovorax boronicumulans]MDP9892592.1 hypothetical protein [Variovorax boronicumulans]MDQ0051928.1 hypothetical protein [Variovorax boronicumulans]